MFSSGIRQATIILVVVLSLRGVERLVLTSLFFL